MISQLSVLQIFLHISSEKGPYDVFFLLQDIIVRLALVANPVS